NPGLLQRLLGLTRPPRPEVVLRLGVSTLGFGASPLDSGALSSLGSALIMSRRSIDPRQVRDALHDLLLKGQTPAVVHLTLGIDAWEQGKVDDARRHWEQAYQLAPDMAVVGNNLAWVLANFEPVDLPRALELCNSLVERFPTQLVYRGTRGHVLVKMKR